MSTVDSLPFAAPKPRRSLTEIEVRRLGQWAKTSTVPAWPTLAAPGTPTPPEMIEQLIGEWTAMRAVIDLVGEFAGDLQGLLARMEQG